jgi:trimeric autotransporter adhesin
MEKCSPDRSSRINRLFKLARPRFLAIPYSGLVILLATLLTLPAAFPVGATANCPGASFNTAPTIPVGTDPLSIAAGDFNGDSNADLVVANGPPDNDLLILMGDGAGGFVPTPRVLPSYITFGCVVVGDFNNDGKADIAGTSLAYDDVQIIYGDGHGGFSTPLEVQAGPRPGIMLAADFNADGRADLAVGSLDYSEGFSHQVSIFLVGNGGLLPAKNVTIWSVPMSLDAGDLNGDGKTDIIVGSGHSDQLMGDGTGNFTRLAGPANVAAVVRIADFNNDNKADLIAVQPNGVDMNVLYGDGTGGFPTSLVLRSLAPRSLLVGDYNADGRADFAVASAGGSRITVMLGASSGGFLRREYIAGSRPVGLIGGDFNHDGKPDLIALNSASTDLSVLFGTTPGDLAAPKAYSVLTASYSLSASPSAIGAGDFNRDGKLDLAVTNLTSRDVAIFLGDGQGGLSMVGIYYVGTGLPNSLTVIDSNGDGLLDILMAFTTESMVTTLRGRGDGTFEVGHPQNLLNGTFQYLYAGDFNGDGKPDLAMLTGRLLRIALNVTEGQFGPSKTWQVGTGSYTPLGFPHVARLADVNRDGKLDVLIPDAAFDESEGVWIGLGDGAGGIASSYKLKVGTGLNGLEVADFNGDSKLDLAASVTTATHNGVSISIGDGAGGFTLRETHDVASGPRDMASGDFNGDGIVDLMVAGENYNALSVLVGQGNGSFSEGVTYGLAAGRHSLVIGDFNRDGKSDAMIADYNSDTVTALLSSPCVLPAPTPTPTPTASPTPTPSPSPSQPPLLLVQEGTNRAIALDSVNMLGEPFSLQTDFNFSTDHRTRVMFYATNAALLAGEDRTAVTAYAFASGQIYPMTVEYVGPVLGMDWLSQIVVRLPDLPSGDALVGISLRGLASNEVLIKIR